MNILIIAFSDCSILFIFQKWLSISCQHMVWQLLSLKDYFGHSPQSLLHFFRFPVPFETLSNLFPSFPHHFYFLTNIAHSVLHLASLLCLATHLQHVRIMPTILQQMCNSFSYWLNGFFFSQYFSFVGKTERRAQDGFSRNVDCCLCFAHVRGYNSFI